MKIITITKTKNMLESSISNRIAFLRFFLISTIVWLHVFPINSDIDILWGGFHFIKEFFVAFSRAGVPILSCISGFLIFKSKAFQDYKILLYKKTKTLLIPFLIWSMFVFLPALTLQFFEITSHNFRYNLIPFDLLTYLNAIFGILIAPINYPLHFLRDLMVIIALIPLWKLFLFKIPFFGLTIISIVFLFNLEGYLILENTMVINFYIGCLLAFKNYDLHALDKHALLSLSLIIILCCVIVKYDIRNIGWFRVVSPVLIWSASSVFLKFRWAKFILKLSPHSYFIYLSHAPILGFFWVIYEKTMFIPASFFGIEIPIIVIFLCIFTRKILIRHSPRTLEFLTGICV